MTKYLFFGKSRGHSQDFCQLSLFQRHFPSCPNLPSPSLRDSSSFSSKKWSGRSILQHGILLLTPLVSNGTQVRNNSMKLRGQQLRLFNSLGTKSQVTSQSQHTWVVPMAETQSKGVKENKEKVWDRLTDSEKEWELPTTHGNREGDRDGFGYLRKWKKRQATVESSCSCSLNFRYRSRRHSRHLCRWGATLMQDPSCRKGSPDCFSFFTLLTSFSTDWPTVAREGGEMAGHDWY